MAAKAGRLFKVQRDTTGAGAYSDVGWMTARSYTVNDEAVDISNETDGRWKALLEGAGNASVSISGSGVWKDETQQAALRAAAFAGTHEGLKIIDGQGDYITGIFHITSFGNSADHNGAVTFDVSFESAGDVAVSW
jgi:TP901-1 family phage major tail protein